MSEAQARKVALIIGAGDATGPAIARRFAREGYVACLTRRSADKLQPLVDEIRAAGGEAHGFASDARKEDQVTALVDDIESRLGPMNIYVAHVVIDGAIDTAFIRDGFPDKFATRDQPEILSPEHIADAYWYLHSQPRDAWTFELDLRPWMERW